MVLGRLWVYSYSFTTLHTQLNESLALRKSSIQLTMLGDSKFKAR
jgi:hypothetical protein